jgi:methanogenic corrinoid protein MtbC1
MKDPERDTQLFSIGEVVGALQARFPDVSHSSLRFLEREGFIASTRTSGGHRKYGQAVIDRIAQIKTWQADGLSLERIRERLAELDHLPNPQALSAEFLEQAKAGNLNAAGNVITRADDVGLSIETQFAEVLTPALHEIGDLWAQGELTVAREKEVSELSRELIVELTRRHATPDPEGPLVVAACVAGEMHELGLRMIAGLLRQRGYRVSFLGADVGLAFLLDAVEARSPAAVLLSAKQPATKPALEAALLAFRQAPAGTAPRKAAIVVGGEVAEADPAMIVRYGATPVPSTDPALALATIEAAIIARAGE